MKLIDKVSFTLTPANEIYIKAPAEMHDMVEYMYEADNIEDWDDLIDWLEDKYRDESFGYDAYSVIIEGDQVRFLDQMGSEDEDEDVGFKTTRAEFLPVAKVYREQLRKK